MKIELKSFFKYYDEKLIHHREAISQLEEALEKLAPELLDDSSDWVNTYRNKPKPEPKPAAILPVPYYPQTDNYTQPERTCNSSACAMALEYFRPGTLRGPKGDDAYIREVFALGDTTDPWVQTKVLAEYGVKTLEDLGEITVQEFKALLPDSGMNDDEVDAIIRAAKETGAE